VRDALDNVPDCVRDAVVESVDDAEIVTLDLLIDSDTAKVSEFDNVARCRVLEGESVCVLLRVSESDVVRLAPLSRTQDSSTKHRNNAEDRRMRLPCD
jgi:hypothetical protein